jgi:ligand-binding sensor domain-containing protein
MLRKSSILFVLLLLVKQIYSQSYNFKNYSVENGLPFIQIFAIHQDSRGYLWTTGYGGLSRFDGKEFINYGPRNGLANHYASAIASCVKGNLWIGTKDGLNEFVNEKDFLTYTIKQGLPSNTVLSLASDEKEKMYVGTDKGLCFVANGVFTTIKELDGYTINCLLHRYDLGLIIGTDKGLFQYRNSKLENYWPDKKTQPVNCLSYNKTGLWIGTPQGLVQLDPQSKKTVVYGINNGLIDDNITSLTCDYGGNTWVGTHSGLMRFNGKEFAYYKISSDINSNNILSSSIDYEENIWLGTHAGMFKYRDEGFVSYGPQDGLIGTMVFPIIRDQQKVLWVGTEQFGLFKYENNVFEQIKTQNKIIGDTINCLTMLNDKLLVGHNAGLTVKDEQGFRQIKNFPRVHVYMLLKDSKNKFWAGSLGAFYSFDLTNKWEAINIQKFQAPGNTTDDQFWGIAEDKQGKLWFAAYHSGLYRYDGTTFEFMHQQLNIKTDDVFNLVNGKGNLIYAASLDGVYEINTETLKSFNFNETNGLSSNLVYSLLLTNGGHTLWAGTNQGACKIDLDEFHSSDKVSVATYGKADGFNGVECNVGMWEDPVDGIVWFATVNGLVKYNPNQFSRNDREAKLNITNIQLFYEDTVLPDNSVLPYDLNNISFHYIGICLSNPEKVRYIHKLEGFDKYWSPETDENVTRYSNLPPGNYTFKVRCSNNEGIWNQPIFFNFTIKRPYYQQWWFIVSVVGFVVSIIILIFRLRINQLKREQGKETEKQIEISKNQLKALRSQMNPHFMFNSLNSIQNYIVNNKDDRAILYLNKFAKLMRMILNNSEKSVVTLREELDAMRLYIELEQMRFQNTFQYEINVNGEIDQDFEQIPTMLIQPYVENAILHGLNPKKEEGLLKIEIRLAGGVMICSIIDNGIGREKSAEMKRNSAKEHKSMGMDITKQRLQILNSVNNSNLSVRINDLKDEKGLPAGTKVDIFIPIT